jgi:hypothetical protein
MYSEKEKAPLSLPAMARSSEQGGKGPVEAGLGGGGDEIGRDRVEEGEERWGNNTTASLLWCS